MQSNRLSALHRVILALDVDNLGEAKSLLESLRGEVGAVKIGKELFTAYGPEAVRLAQEAGFSVFLDLKYHDIPQTVAAAVRAAARLGVEWLSLHTAGGEAMMQSAASARDEFPPDERPRLLGVTVLTSLALVDTEEVVERGLAAQRCGLDGAIASPLEVGRLRRACGPEFLLVTPGVRPTGSEAADQKRVATPSDAVRDGADLLVIGRPIHAAREPKVAAQAIAAEIAACMPLGAAAPQERSSVESRLLDMLRDAGAFLEGHFVLTSGLHSDRYVQCAQLLKQPHYARRAGLWLADRLRDYKPDVVVSVALGGVVIGQEVAAALQVPALFAERSAEGVLQLRRGFVLEPETRVAIVDDVCTRGGSIAECAELIRDAGARVVVCGAIIDRSGGNRAFDLPFEALKVIEAQAFDPSECDACRSGVPTEKPGSRKNA